MDNLTKYRLAELSSADPERADYLRSVMGDDAPPRPATKRKEKAQASKGAVETREG